MWRDVASVVTGTCGTAVSALTRGLGRAGVSAVSDRQSYKSDLSDERWATIEPVITAWKARHHSVSGHQGNYDMREIVNALLYQSRTGCQWDYLPHDLPPAGAVKYYFYEWRDDGTDQTIHDLLRWQVREKRGRARCAEDVRFRSFRRGRRRLRRSRSAAWGQRGAHAGYGSAAPSAPAPGRAAFRPGHRCRRRLRLRY
jgi:transposase